MLQFRLLSLSRQSNPSILTAGLLPKFALTQPPFLEEDDGDEETPEGMGIESGEIGVIFSSPNRASWIIGLDTRLGGDPLKKGGDEAACVQDCSAPYPPCGKKEKTQYTVKSNPSARKMAFNHFKTYVDANI